MMERRILTIFLVFSLAYAVLGQERMSCRLPGYFEGNLRFEFTHSLRITDYHITIDFYRRPWTDTDYVEMRVISLPMPGHEGDWGGSVIDRTSNVPLAEYQRLWQMSTSLRVEDLAEDFDVRGNDGKLCTIAFGGFQTSVALTAWSPDYDPERRGLGPFYKVCKSFLEVAGLKPGKVF